jgi:hypothetical protein
VLSEPQGPHQRAPLHRQPAQGALLGHRLFCLDYRLREPVNYIRANWIRPEDLHHYEALGYDNFKIVERNTPTPVLLNRVRAYAARRYDGNLFDLVLPFQYPENAYTNEAARDAFSLKRAVRHFLRPSQVNVTRIPQVAELCGRMGLLYPMREDPPPLYLDNRKLDGFLDRFLDQSCIDLDCETCRYCHQWAQRTVEVDPAYREQVLAAYRKLFEDMNTGDLYEHGRGDFVELGRLTARLGRRVVEKVRAPGRAS